MVKIPENHEVHGMGTDSSKRYLEEDSPYAQSGSMASLANWVWRHSSNKRWKEENLRWVTLGISNLLVTWGQMTVATDDQWLQP